jgi:hypothetical protein
MLSWQRIVETTSLIVGVVLLVVIDEKHQHVHRGWTRVFTELSVPGGLSDHAVEASYRARFCHALPMMKSPKQTPNRISKIFCGRVGGWQTEYVVSFSGCNSKTNLHVRPYLGLSLTLGFCNPDCSAASLTQLV